MLCRPFAPYNDSSDREDTKGNAIATCFMSPRSNVSGQPCAARSLRFGCKSLLGSSYDSIALFEIVPSAKKLNIFFGNRRSAF